MKDLDTLINEHSILVRADFARAYKAYNPALSRMLYSFPTGYVKNVTYIFNQFLGGLKKFTGTRNIEKPAPAWSINVENELYDKAIEIPLLEARRAAENRNPLQSLGLYTKNIAALGPIAKDEPIRQALKMLEAGTTDTYGTAFDGQTFFSNTHDFSNTAGTQSNIITGTGITNVALYNDLQSAEAAMLGFTYEQGERRENLIDSLVDRDMIIIAPPAVAAAFRNLMRATKITINGVEVDNPYREMTVISRSMADANDWYLLNVNDELTGILPFLNPVEQEPELDTPLTPYKSDPHVREYKKFVYGVDTSFGTGYGAWWKAIKVVND